MRLSSPFNTFSVSRSLGRVLSRSVRLYRHALRVGRWSAYAGTAIVILAAAALLATRLWLPTLAQNKDEIERRLSERSGRVVRVQAVEAYWDGLHPGLRLEGVQLRAAAGTDAPAAVELRELRVSLAWSPLLRGRLAAHRLALIQPSLALERLADGRLQFRGLPAGNGVRTGVADQFVTWLFAQNEIVIEDGTLQWRDDHEAAGPLTLSRVNLSLRNDGQRHRFNLNAQFPTGVCADCSLIADVRGNPLERESWGGRIYLRAREVQVAGLPLILRERLPGGLGGTFRAQLWSDWADGRPQAVNGELRVDRLQVPASAHSDAVEIRQAAAEVDWERRGAGWRLDLRAPEVALGARSWDLGSVRLQYHPRRTSLRLQNADLDDIGALLGRLQGAYPWLATLRALDLKGRVRDIRAEVEGPWSAPDDYRLSADLIDLAAAPYARLPGFRGLRGRVEMTKTGGRFVLATRDTTFDFPHVFADPIDVKSATGTVRWQRGDDQWTVVARDLKMQSADGFGSASVELRLPFDRARSPELRLRADVRGIDARRAPRYYPLRLSERTRAWLAASIAGGRLTRADVVLEGPLRSFPFRNGDGRFEVRGHVSNGEYRYLPGWVPLTQVEADLLFKGPEMLITGQGRLRGLAARDIAVRVPDLGIQLDQRMVRVTGNIAGPLADAMAVLRDRPSEKWSTLLSPALQARGDGVLDLELTIFPRDPAATQITGEYKVADASFLLPLADGLGPRVEGVRGGVAFTEAGPVGGRLDGRVLGGEASVSLARSAHNPRVAGRLQAQGRVTAAGLATWSAPAARLVQGEATWRAQAQLDGAGAIIEAGADLQDLAVILPPPLDKARGAPLHLQVATRASGPQRQVLDLQAGDRVSGRFEFGRDAEEAWRFVRGHLRAGTGEPVLPAASGIWLSVSAPHLDGDLWLRQLSGGRAASPPGTQTSVAAELLPAVLNRISLDVDALTLLGRQFARTSADLVRAGANWNGTLLGSAIAGKVNLLQSSERTRLLLNAELDHLRVPPKVLGPVATRAVPADDADPRRLPAMRVRAKAFEIGGRGLGALDFAGMPMPQGYKVQQLILKRPEMHLVAQGDWLGTGAAQRTEVNGKLVTTDMAQSLAALGIEGEVARGHAELSGRLGWDGGPAALQLNALRGRVVLHAQDGAFVKVKQGAGKLLGLFDVRSLSRYVNLDFSSVFGKGYVFDSISGELRLEAGNAYTDEIVVIGPSARLRLEGRVGLAQRDLDLKLGVNPHLRDNVTVASGLIGGPIGAGTALVVQRLFKKQIAEGTRVVYTVKGSWDQPAVQRLHKNGTPAS